MLGMDNRTRKFFGDFSNMKTRKQRRKVRKRVDRYREKLRNKDTEMDKIIRDMCTFTDDCDYSIDDIPDEYEVVFE